MCCKKIKVSITARDKVLDPDWWTNSKMFVSCSCCNIHHLVDPVLQKAGFVSGNFWGFWCRAVACLVPISCNHINLITGALKGHASNTFTSDTRRISDMLLSKVMYTNTCHLHPCSWEIFYFLCITMFGLSPRDFEDCPRYTPDAQVILWCVVSRNLFDISFLTNPSSNRQTMIIIEAGSDLCLFETLPVRIKTTSIAIHEKMRPEVLDDIDEIIVVLWFVISIWIMLSIDVVIYVWCKLL